MVPAIADRATRCVLYYGNRCERKGQALMGPRSSANGKPRVARTRGGIPVAVSAVILLAGIRHQRLQRSVQGESRQLHNQRLGYSLLGQPGEFRLLRPLKL